MCGVQHVRLHHPAGLRLRSAGIHALALRRQLGSGDRLPLWRHSRDWLLVRSPPAATGSLFGAAPQAATGSLFGGAQPSLFGAPAAAAPASTSAFYFGGGFGATAAPAASNAAFSFAGAFGASQPQTAQTSMFGATATQVCCSNPCSNQGIMMTDRHFCMFNGTATQVRCFDPRPMQCLVIMGKEVAAFRAW